MIIVTLIGILTWHYLRRAERKYPVAIFLIVIAITSLFVISGVRAGGVFWEDVSPDFDIVHYNSPLLFPFVIQRHHNWSSHEYSFRVLLIGSEGGVVLEEAPRPDQSEYMHWSLVVITASFCGLGFLFALVVIVFVKSALLFRGKKTEKTLISLSG